MSRRIQLLIDKSGVAEGVTFKVHRSTEQTVSVSDPLLMEIKELDAPHAILRTVETVTQDYETTNLFRTQRPFFNEPAPVVYINGSLVPAGDVEAYGETGEIFIHNQSITRMFTGIVSVEYSYEGLTILDDDRNQSGVTYHGIPATNAPTNLTVVASGTDTVVTWQAPVNTYYYVIVANDKYGHISPISLQHGIVLFSNSLAGIRYVLEWAPKSAPGDWTATGRLATTTYTVPLDQGQSTHNWRVSAIYADGAISDYVRFGGE